MKWFRKHKKIMYLVLIIVVLLILIVFSFKTIDRSSTLGGLVQRGVTTVSEPFAKAGNGIANTFRGIFRFNAVVLENEELTKEINALKKENIDLALSMSELEELRNLSQVLNYSGVEERTGLVTADVIFMDGSNWFNLFTINSGTEKGVHKDAVVVNGVGLVGRVIDTGEGWSKVLGIIDESNKVSFKVLRDPALLGIVEGNGLNGLSGYMLDGKASVIEGDILVTTNIGIYPEGIEIGEITEIVFDNDTQLKKVTIAPMVNFKSIQKVAVIL